MLSRFVLRLVLIPIGYTAAILAATLALVLGAYGPFLANQHEAGAETLAVLGAFVEGGIGFFVIGTAAFLPAAAAIVIAETFSIRYLLYYAGVGALFALAPDLFAPATGEAAFYPPQAVLAAALLGGLAYWGLAGRGAGMGARRDAASSAPARPSAAEPARSPEAPRNEPA